VGGGKVGEGRRGRGERAQPGVPHDPPAPPLPPPWQAAHHASTRSLTLVGVYAANERLADAALPPAARSAADAVARAAGTAPLALLLDGETLPSYSAGKGGIPLIAWTKSGGGGGAWVASPRGAGVSASAGASGLFAAAVADGKLDAVADFDDHLIDLRKDWLNEALVA
jgi:hypothetical protein